MLPVKIKVKKSDRKQELESFGNNMYLAYVMSDEPGVDIELVKLLSKKLGVPPGRIQLRSKNGSDRVYDIS